MYSQTLLTYILTTKHRLARQKKRDRKRARQEELRGRRIDDDADEKKIWVSVKALGAVGLKGKEKWKYQSELIQSLGGKKPKNRKVPLHILLGMRKKEKKREAWRQNEIKQSGVVVARPQDVTQKSKKRRRKREDKESFMRPSFGHFKGGTLFVGNRGRE